MKRVMIVGAPGSGKSTLARMIGEKTKLPVYHMDHIHWKAGWIGRTVDEKTSLSNEVHCLDEWIFEGGYSRTYDVRLSRADTLIWLDFPLLFRMFRLARRTIVHLGKARPDLPDGCKEKFNWQTLEFFHFVITTSRRSKIRHQAIIENAPKHLNIVHLQNLKQVNGYIDGL